MVREVINDDTDLNSVTKNGIYQLINANGENTPTGWWMLVVFANGGYGLQIVSNVSKDTVVKLRTMNENGFNDWKTVSLTWLKNGWSGTSRCHPIRQITYNMLIAYNEVFGQH